MPSILLVGAGAVGLVYGYHLQQDESVELSIIARSNYQDIKDNGVQIVLDDGTHVYHPKLVISDSDKETFEGAKPYDKVIIAAKSKGDEAIAGLEKYIGKDTLVILAQNGIDIEPPYLSKYPGIHLVSSIIKVSAAGIEGGKARYFGGKLQVHAGLITPDKTLEKNLQQFGEISTRNGVNFELSTHIARDRWEKLLWNGTFNSLTAVTNLGLHDLFASNLGELAEKIMTEIWTIAESQLGDGDWVPKSRITELISFTQNIPDTGFLPSTLQDVRKGKEIEFEALTGNAVRIAHRNGIAIPNLEVVYQLLAALNYRLVLEAKAKQSKQEST